MSVSESCMFDTPFIFFFFFQAEGGIRVGHVTGVQTCALPISNRRLGIVAVLISTVGMGLSGLFARLATPEGAATGEALTLGRMGVGALGMLAILAMTGRLSQLKVRLSGSVVLGGLLLGLSLSTYLSATVLTDLSRAVVLHYLGPVLSTVLARAVLKERISPADALSLGVSFL